MAEQQAYQEEVLSDSQPLGPQPGGNGSDPSAEELAARQADHHYSQQVAAQQEELVQEAPPPPPPPQPPQRRGRQALESSRYTVTGPASDMAQLMAQQSRTIVTPPPRKEVRDARTPSDILDGLISEPESVNWSLVIHRYGPPVYERKQVVRGALHKTVIMRYSQLLEEIKVALGGGDYRVVAHDESGQPIGGKCFEVCIPVTLCRPKNKPYEEDPVDPATLAVSAPAELTESQKEILRMRADQELEIERERQARANMRSREAKLQLLQQEKRIREMEREINRDEKAEQPDQMVTLLQKQIELLTQQLKEIGKDSSDKIEKSEARFEKLIEKIAEKPKEGPSVSELMTQMQQAFQNQMNTLVQLMTAKKDDGGDKKAQEFLVLMQDSSNKALAAITTALAGRNDGGKEMRELMQNNTTQMTQLFGNALTALAPARTGEMSEQQKMVMETNKSMMDLVMRASTKDNQAQNALVTSLINATLQQKQESPMNFGEILKIMGELEQRQNKNFDRFWNMTQKMMPQGTDEVPSGPEDAYNPREGVMGNVARAVFNGIKNAIPMAMGNPALMAWLTEKLGGNPAAATDDAIARASSQIAMTDPSARQIALSGHVPQMIAPPMAPRQLAGPVGIQPAPMQHMQVAPQYFQQGQMRPGQSPLITPQAPPMVPFSSAPRVGQPGPSVAPPVAMNPMQPARPGQAPMGQPVAQIQPIKMAVPAAPPVQPAPPAQSMAPATNAPVVAATPPPPAAQAVVATPTQVQQSVSSELGGMAEGIDMAAPAAIPPMPPPPAMPQAPAPASVQPEEPLEDEDTPQGRLRVAVTEAMIEAVKNISDRVKSHSWPEIANGTWSGDFLDALAGAADREQRMAMIASNCYGQVWDGLTKLLGEVDAGQQMVFFNEAVDQVVKYHREDISGAAAAEQQVQ